MGRRGPTAKGEFADKSSVLSTRISTELRERLEAEVAKRGLTISREVEHRLRKSFNDDEKAADQFGTRRNRAFMKMLGMLMQTVSNPVTGATEWLDDPWLFQQFRLRLDSLLRALQPAGDPVPPSNVYFPGDQDSDVHEYLGAADVVNLIADVQGGDSRLPLDVSARQHLLNMLKIDIGPVVDRPGPIRKVMPGKGKVIRSLLIDEMDRVRKKSKVARKKRAKRELKP